MKMYESMLFGRLGLVIIQMRKNELPLGCLTAVCFPNTGILV
jgi:hypothetical protein